MKSPGLALLSSLVLFVVSCGNKNQTDPLSLCNRPFQSEEVQSFVKSFGEKPEVKNFDEVTFYIFKKSGIDFRVSTSDTIIAIFLFNENSDGHQQYKGEIPYGLAFDLSRAEIRNILGQEGSTEGTDWSGWDHKGIMITWEESIPGTFDLIHHITVYTPE